MNVSFKLIGQRICEIRIQQKITQAELAEISELSVSFICLVENGKKKASLKSLIKISNALGITVDELLNGNQLYNPTEYQTDIDLLMADCSGLEKRFIFEIIKATKAILRKNNWFLSDKED